MAKAFILKEKHEIEKQEQILKNRRETLELQTRIAATTAKINYLKDAEMTLIDPLQYNLTLSQRPVLGAEAAEKEAGAKAATGAQLDERLESLFYPDEVEDAAVVRSKTGVGVNFPSLNLHADIEPVASSSTLPQLFQFVPQQASARSVPPVIHHKTPRLSVTSAQITPGQASSAPSSAQETHLIKVLENQNDLTRILMRQQLLSTLPQENIPVFDGQILEYK